MKTPERRSGVFIVNFEHILTLFSSASIVNFKQVNVSWEQVIFVRVARVFTTNNNQQVVYNRQKQPPEVFCQKGVLKNFAKCTGKRLCQSLFFNKVKVLKPATSFKKRFWHRFFPVKFAKFLRTPFFKEHLLRYGYRATNEQLHLSIFSEPWINHYEEVDNEEVNAETR